MRFIKNTYISKVSIDLLLQMNQNPVLGHVRRTERTLPHPNANHVRTQVSVMVYTYYMVGGPLEENSTWTYVNMVGGMDTIPAHCVGEEVASYLEW